MRLSIIIPVLNESQTIVRYLQDLRHRIISEQQIEIIIVDGGSTDNTVALVAPYADYMVCAPKGRASQMNAGAQQASGEYLLFLHADTQLPENAFSFLQSYPYPYPYPQWGFYRVALSGKAWFFRVIERMINWRSCMTQVATGDQCLFVRHSLFLSVSGFSNIPLMEDVDISKRLRRQFSAYIVNTPVVTSSRKWEQGGIVKTITLMWYLRGLYFFGVSPHYLVKKYYSS